MFVVLLAGCLAADAGDGLVADGADSPERGLGAPLHRGLVEPEVVPVPPTALDLASAEQYLRMAGDVRGRLGGRGYAFVRLVASRVGRTKPRQVETLELMRERLGDYLAQAPLFVAGAIPERSACGGTLLSGAGGDRGRDRAGVGAERSKRQRL